MVEQWVMMWNRYDLSLVDSLFVRNEGATYFSSEKQGLIRGIDAIREHHRSFGFVAGGKKQDNRLWVEDLHSGWYSGAIVVTGVWYFKKPSQGQGEAQFGPMTMVYSMVDGEWRIAHMHFANYKAK